MRRRTVFVGAGATVLAAVGAGLATFRPALRHDGLTDSGRAVMQAIASRVLDGALPGDPQAAAAELVRWTDRFMTAVSQLPSVHRDELGDLLALLATPASRVLLTGLLSDWSSAAPADVDRALESLRTSSLLQKRQAFAALRDLTQASFYADAATWASIGYPGPHPV